jgi:integrase
MAVLVREKKKGSDEWWVFINHKGKRRSKKIGSKRAANAVKREVEERLSKGELGFLAEKKPTLAVFGNKYVNDPDQKWAPNTRNNYVGMFKNHIRPHAISRIELDKIEMYHIKDFIGDLNQTDLGKGTKQLIKTVLHLIFEEAKLYNHVKANPCSRTGKFIVGNEGKDEVPEEINAYTPEEAAQQIEHSKSLGLLVHAVITVFIRTGLRVGELLGLNWGDIDLEERTAAITKPWDYLRKTIRPTKTKSNREIDLSPYVVNLLNKLKGETQFNRDNDPVFSTDTGKRLDYFWIQRQFYKVRLRENITLGALRHTYATIRIAKGDNIIDVSRQLGHKKPSMTLDKYAEWLPRHHKDQVDELDTLHLSASHTHPEVAHTGQDPDSSTNLH